MVYDRNVSEVLEFFDTKADRDKAANESDIGAIVGGYEKSRKHTEKIKGTEYEFEESVLITIHDLLVYTDKQGKTLGDMALVDHDAVRAKKSCYAIHLQTESFGSWYAADTIVEALDLAKKLFDANSGLVR